jgi:hypothetical protein
LNKKYYRVEYEIAEDKYRGADKSLAQLAFRYILFDDENISFDASFVIYINSKKYSSGTRGGVVVKALRYKPADRGFDLR